MVIELKLDNIKKYSNSIILFGSFATNTENEFSDIDLLILTKTSKNHNLIKNNLLELDKKIEPQILTLKDFKEKILTFNPQLISIFYDGKILIDKNNFYKKNRNLFLALNYNNDYKITYKKKEYSLKKLIMHYGN